MKTKQVLIYDAALLPNNWTMHRMAEMYEKGGMVIYNSCAAGNFGGKNAKPEERPTVINVPEGVDIKFIDLDKEPLPNEAI